MNSNIPKTISRIAVTIFLTAIAVIALPSFWFWVSFETIAVSLVAIGCSGEWYLHHHPAGRKKREKDDHHKFESRFIGAVALGVTMEIFALGHSIQEGVKLDDKVSKANERTALVESNNLVLQAKLKTRIITDEEREKFIECLRGEPKGPVQLRHDRGASANVRFYANEIAELLIAAGYSIPSGVDICDVKPILPADTSIEVWTKSLKDGPSYFFPLANCLKSVAEKVVPNVNDSPIFFTTNEIFIYIANYR